jgi:hypothetical protein
MVVLKVLLVVLDRYAAPLIFVFYIRVEKRLEKTIEIYISRKVCIE